MLLTQRYCEQMTGRALVLLMHLSGHLQWVTWVGSNHLVASTSMAAGTCRSKCEVWERLLSAALFVRARLMITADRVELHGCEAPCSTAQARSQPQSMQQCLQVQELTWRKLSRR